MRSALIVSGTAVFVLVCGVCRTGPASGASSAAQQATRQFRPEAIRAHVTFLADDALEGRGTGTRGHELAAKYLRSQLSLAGAEGGSGQQDFFQKVPLVRTRVDEKVTRFELRGGSDQRDLVYGADYVLLDTHAQREGGASGKVVFVG